MKPRTAAAAGVSIGSVADLTDSPSSSFRPLPTETEVHHPYPSPSVSTAASPDSMKPVEEYKSGEKQNFVINGAEDTTALYNAIAPHYDTFFQGVGHRVAYDRLAWEYALEVIGNNKNATIVDAGCGTGRWAEKLVALGHTVIGIEPSVGMSNVLMQRDLLRNSPKFSLINEEMEHAVSMKPNSVDVVLALGSVQYTPDPANAIKCFKDWVKPGGWVAIHVDSLANIVLELATRGKKEEAYERLETRVGVWQQNGQRSCVHLMTSHQLRKIYEDAGLVDIRLHGLAVSSVAWGAEGCRREHLHNEDEYLELERRLSKEESLVDVGKHVMIMGRKPF